LNNTIATVFSKSGIADTASVLINNTGAAVPMRPRIAWYYASAIVWDIGTSALARGIVYINDIKRSGTIGRI
jgi:hypothetical protein